MNLYNSIIFTFLLGLSLFITLRAVYFIWQMNVNRNSESVFDLPILVPIMSDEGISRKALYTKLNLTLAGIYF